MNLFVSFEQNHKFLQMSWNFMNDSLRTDCFVRHQPETIACACIYLSARKLKIPLPRRPNSWYELLGVDEDDIKECCYKIICLYQRKSVKQEELEKIVEKLKQIHDEKKKENNKLLAGLKSVNSPASQPSSPHSKKDRKDDDRSRSRSRSLDRKKKKKAYKKERSPSSERYSSRDKKKLAKGKRERDWSHSPIHKSRKGRSRSRERLSDRYRNERRSEKSDKSYSDKYKKGERMDRDYYRR